MHRQEGNDDRDSAPWTVPQSNPALVDFSEETERTEGTEGGGGDQL